MAKTKKTAAKAASKKSPAKKAGIKKPLAKKMAFKKTAVKKTAVKAPVKKTIVKQTAVEKGVVKKAMPAKPIPAKPTAAKPVAAKVVEKKPAKVSGFSENLRDAALKILDERQGEEVVTFDLAGKSAVADYLIVASARAARQISAIAHYLREMLVEHGIKQVRIEGLREGNWAIVDGGDIIVHLFRPEVRTYYNLESLWDGSRERKGRPAS